jgi:hypothetical protein
MSRFSVVFSDEAQDQLAQVWLDAGPERNAVTVASHAIEQALASDPLGCGEPEHEGLRKLDMPPLHVLYVVEEDARVVRVVLVRRTPPPLPNPQANGPVSKPS